MNRERALKVVLVLVGLLFCASVYPLILMAKQDPALAMMMSLYATLGVFLLLASRNPSDHRSLIAFAAWSSFAHAGIMSLQALLNIIARRELIGSAVFILIGVALIALAPAKQTTERTVAVGL
jgi:tryptophan-rich sensory protein